MSDLVKKVVFISSSCGGTLRYRVFHQAEQLRMQGITVLVLDASRGKLSGSWGQADVVIVHRLAYSYLLKAIIQESHQQGTVLLMDVDDLIFEPSLAPGIGGYPKGEEKRQDFIQYLENQRQTLKVCDGVIVTTERLAAECRKINPNVMVNRNALCSTTLRLSEVLNDKAPLSRSTSCTLGYFSGSPTHDNDFSTIVGALNQVLQKFPQVSLVLAGYLSQPRDLKFKERIRYLNPIPWELLPTLIKKVDVNLAPLDTTNPFCHCKSEVKYIEAGICHVPTVASNTDGFREVIKDGENGLLADGDNEWSAKISKLVTDSIWRRSIAERAYRHVSLEYSPRKRSAQFLANMTVLVKKILRERMSKRGSINNYPSL